MYQYRLSVYVGGEPEVLTLHRSNPIEDKEIQKLVAQLVNELVASLDLDPVGSVEWSLSEVTEVKSGEYKY